MTLHDNAGSRHDNRKKVLLLAAFSLLAISLFTLPANAVPNTLSLLGKLSTQSGSPQVGTYNISFRIYDQFTEGNMLYENTANVTTDILGVYEILLEGVSLNFSEQYYLALAIANDSEATPRVNISTAPYAVRANLSESLNPASAYTIASLNVTSGAVIAGLNVSGATALAGGLSIAGSANVTGNATIGDRILFSIGNFLREYLGAIYFSGNVTIGENLGINVTSPAKRLVVGGSAGSVTIDTDINPPVINTTGNTNVTITSSGGSVIIRLG